MCGRRLLSPPCLSFPSQGIPCSYVEVASGVVQWPFPRGSPCPSRRPYAAKAGLALPLLGGVVHQATVVVTLASVGRGPLLVGTVDVPAKEGPATVGRQTVPRGLEILVTVPTNRPVAVKKLRPTVPPAVQAAPLLATKVVPVLEVDVGATVAVADAVPAFDVGVDGLVVVEAVGHATPWSPPPTRRPPPVLELLGEVWTPALVHTDVDETARLLASGAAVPVTVTGPAGRPGAAAVARVVLLDVVGRPVPVVHVVRGDDHVDVLAEPRVHRPFAVAARPFVRLLVASVPVLGHANRPASPQEGVGTPRGDGVVLLTVEMVGAGAVPVLQDAASAASAKTVGLPGGRPPAIRAKVNITLRVASASLRPPEVPL